MVSALRMRVRKGKFREPDLLLLRDRSDPRDATINVLTLDGDSYVEHGMFARGRSATSVLLDDFTVDVRRCSTPRSRTRRPRSQVPQPAASSANRRAP